MHATLTTRYHQLMQDAQTLYDDSADELEQHLEASHYGDCLVSSCSYCETYDAISRTLYQLITVNQHV